MSVRNRIAHNFTLDIVGFNTKMLLLLFFYDFQSIAIIKRKPHTKYMHRKCPLNKQHIKIYLCRSAKKKKKEMGAGGEKHSFLVCLMCSRDVFYINFSTFFAFIPSISFVN